MLRKWLMMLMLVGAVPVTAAAQDADRRLEDLKQMVMELNSDLAVLEEQLLYPVDAQFTVFMATEAAGAFRLSSVELKLDGKLLTSYLYSDAENEALRRGGVQRLYLGNLKSGKYDLQADVVGIGAAGKEFRQTRQVMFEKEARGRYLELRVRDEGKAPLVSSRVW